MPKNKGKNGAGPDKREMTAREYINTPEYQEEAQREIEEMMEKFSVDLEPAMEIMRQAQESLSNSGAIQAMDEIARQHKKLVDDLSIVFPRKESSVMYYSPQTVQIDPGTVNHMIRRTADEVEKRIANPISSSDIFILEESGDLYRKDDRSKCYRLRGKGMRHKTVRALFEHSLAAGPTFKNSNELAEEIGYANRETLAKAIGEINRQARIAFGLLGEPEKRFITSKDFDGYRINPLYKIQKG